MPSPIAAGTIPYSEEDYRALVSTLSCYVDRRYDEGQILVMCSLTLESALCHVDKRSLKAAFIEPENCAEGLITNFLYNASIEEVPLYLNSYPELAKMRLTKGR